MTGSTSRRERRAVLRVALGVAFGAGVWKAEAIAEANPKTMRPQPGDRFTYASGTNKGEIVRIDDLPAGGPAVLAYPLDPKTKTVRSGSRLNQVALVRLDPSELDEETKAGAAEGVVAYSAVCTHQGCPVSMWKAGNLYCSCHGSQFDPARAAEVVSGPAPRRLAALPLAAEDGVLVAAGEFKGRVGFKK